MVWPPHPAQVTFELSDIAYQLVGISPPWVVLVLSLRLSAVRLSSLSALSLRGSLMPDSGHLSGVIAAVACGLASSSGVSSFGLSGIGVR